MHYSNQQHPSQPYYGPPAPHYGPPTSHHGHPASHRTHSAPHSHQRVGEAAKYYGQPNLGGYKPPSTHQNAPSGPSQPYTLVLERTSHIPNKPETLKPTDRPHTLFTIHHKPHSFSSEPSLKVTQPDGKPIGTANIHTFSSRVELTPAGRAGISYKSGQLPPAATPAGETWRWDVSGKPDQEGCCVARLMATTQGAKTSRWRSSGSQGQSVAAVYLQSGLKEGMIEVLRPGMPQHQFELVVMAAVVQIEQLRKKAAQAAKKTSDPSGG